MSNRITRSMELSAMSCQPCSHPHPACLYLQFILQVTGSHRWKMGSVGILWHSLDSAALCLFIRYVVSVFYHSPVELQPDIRHAFPILMQVSMQPFLSLIYFFIHHYTVLCEMVCIVFDCTWLFLSIAVIPIAKL